MNFANFVPVIGTIRSIEQGTDCCSRMVSLRTTGRELLNFLVTPETIVIDSRQLRPGMRIAAFYDKSLPVPLIYPPQYRAQMITALGRNEQIMLNYFNGSLTATDQSLQLTPGRMTEIRTVNGQEFNCRLGNQALLVYYTETTRSIPPQTTPRRIIVVCGDSVRK